MIFKFEPIFVEKVWGSTEFNKIFGYNNNNIYGEVIGISGLRVQSNIITNTKYRKNSLYDLFKNRRDLFGNYKSPEFPIQIKLLDATEDLSLQVHPDAMLSINNEVVMNNDECWYIFDAEYNSHLVLGHKVGFFDDISLILKQKLLLENVIKTSVVKDTFYYVPAGTLHSVGKGVKLLEVKKSPSITFRLYDFGRDVEGSKRKLEIEEAINALKIPTPNISLCGEGPYFKTVIITNNNASNDADIFGDYIFIIEGEVSIGEEKVRKGEFIFISSLSKYQMIGNSRYLKVNIK